MSLHSGKYRSAVREAEVTWQVRQGEEAETTGHQGRQGRKAKADPVRLAPAE